MLSISLHSLGMAEGCSEGLFDSSDLKQWSVCFDCYSTIIAQISAQKEKSSKAKPKKPNLVELDTWYQHDLPGLVSTRQEPHLKHDELCKLMAWKLTRGKFRPRLTELVRENSSEKVEQLSREAFASLPNLKRAVEHLCQLRGVGPATASAVMCAGAPDKAPFMADESVMAVPGLGKLEYTLKHYISYAKAITDKAKELCELGSDGDQDGCKTSWTAHDVELALWAHHFARKLRPELLKLDTEATTSQRKRTNGCADSEGPSTKKSKS